VDSQHAVHTSMAWPASSCLVVNNHMRASNLQSAACITHGAACNPVTCSGHVPRTHVALPLDAQTRTDVEPGFAHTRIWLWRLV
jgi:hypothetical protein